MLLMRIVFVAKHLWQLLARGILATVTGRLEPMNSTNEGLTTQTRTSSTCDLFFPISVEECTFDYKALHIERRFSKNSLIQSYFEHEMSVLVLILFFSFLEKRFEIIERIAVCVEYERP